MLQSPALYDAWRPLSRYLNTDSRIDFRTREIAILRTAWRVRSDYAWGQHALAAARGGIDEDTIRRVAIDPVPATWSSIDRRLLELVDAMCDRTPRVTALASEMRDQLGVAQLLELVILVGHYIMVGVAMNVAGVPREPGVPALGNVGDQARDT
jgi:alkylhydroperoxidase family enzyme